ncbi:MAG: DEAD/DEAH box helicase family protein [SAR324 cluster bacterium]|uniref:DEAD/DEAH box helicase family protein n=1 Tax=SAR324 cluster bacterium TaxID=2024889 RepID=A0A7X9IKW7_9DELT|nr:DEAD/DEAH box helicase family protein [SAR324 cluster bacterium]
MVDFRKLREERKQSQVIHPIEIFRRLPKPSGINDLYTSQAEVLETWNTRRGERDIVIKLHTGGGKTLVGLLIAQSILNETNEPVLYLCSTRQLVEQTVAKSEEYGLPCVSYESGGTISEEFLAARKPLVCTYKALFNGKSKFGVIGTGKPIIKIGGIILDDAHVAYSLVREAFTIKIDRDNDPETYEFITNTFRKDFDDIGCMGTYDDIIDGAEKYGILEVPYWSLDNHKNEIVEKLRHLSSDSFVFPWPLIRDDIDICHMLISWQSVVITPFLPMMDKFPSFSNCPRRIYMSATIADDSSIIRTFDVDLNSVSNPITSRSLAGVGERMILIPELTKISANTFDLVRNFSKWIAENEDIGTVVLVPSNYQAELWDGFGTISVGSEEVLENIKKLIKRESSGPFVFANRYDGIDLPHDTCRLLILSGIPRGTSEYENYISTLFDGSILNNTLAQRIEQGIGRAVRGSGDFCVVLLSGKDLVTWLSTIRNLRFLTRITRAELEIGEQISGSIMTRDELYATIRKCLNRDDEWLRYHAETLADLSEPDPIVMVPLQNAEIEQRVLRLWRDGHHEKAINSIKNHLEITKEIEKETIGWMNQLSARIAFSWKKYELAVEFQSQAFANNRSLLKPLAESTYTRLIPSSNQSKSMVEKIIKYQFRRGYLTYFENLITHLVPEASSNQFEQALANLGDCLGFTTERPEKSFGKGPDVLWLLNEKDALIIEAKSKKEKENPLTKSEHGQLLVSEQWFINEYPEMEGVRVSLHPNRKSTDNAVAEVTRVLTLEKLNILISNTRQVLSKLCNSLEARDQLIILCDELLIQHKLSSQDLINDYLEFFEVVSS